MKETNIFEEAANQEKLLTHILHTTLFCEECGITETSPSFGQQYCRYCGAIFKEKSWIHRIEVEERDERQGSNNDGWCNTCEYKHLESECLGCAKYDEYDNLIALSHYKKEGEDESDSNNH